MDDLIDFGKKITEEAVTGIATARSLRKKECYLPATVFTGRT